MARKHVPDLLVCQVVFEMQHEERVAGRPNLIQRLMERTGECEKVCYAAAWRTADRNLIEYGVAVRHSWLTRKGRAFLEQDRREKQEARDRRIEIARWAAQDALWRKVATDTQKALNEALSSIDAAADLGLVALAERMRRVVVGESEAIYFDDTPLVLIHPMEVITAEDGSVTATRQVERLL